jgi:hypothetical protein
MHARIRRGGQQSGEVETGRMRMLASRKLFTHGVRVVTAALVAAAMLALAAGFALAAQAPAARKAKITARPDNVMVNGHSTLTGRGFPAHAVLALRECGRTFWLVPNEPCNTRNAVSVKTDARGRFTTTFSAEVCPEGQPGKVITERTCYIGVPRVSEDTVALEGAAKIIVTYP